VTDLRIRCTAVAVALALAMLGVQRLAWAESMLVLVAKPANDATTAEVVQRIRGELIADGFKVLLIEAVARADRVRALTGTSRAAGVAVAAGLFVEDDATSVELYLVDAVHGRILTRGIETRPHLPEQAPEVLARRTVDLLRASLLDFLVETLQASAAEPRERPKPPPSPDMSDRAAKSGWVLEGGLGALASFEGLGPALLPLVRIRRLMSEAFHLRMTGAWLGTQPQVALPQVGTASVEQGLALVECVARPWRESRLRPLFAVGAGVYFVGVHGSGMPPYQDAHANGFAAAVDAGLGVGTPVASHLELVLELHALVTAPGLAVRFAGVDEARIGRPSLFSTITLAGSI